MKMTLRAQTLVLIILVSATLPRDPNSHVLLPAVEAASFVYSVRFLRELLLTPEVTECIESIPEEDVDEYLKLVSAAQIRCERTQVDFDACLEALRKSRWMPVKMKNIDNLIKDCS